MIVHGVNQSKSPLSAWVYAWGLVEDSYGTIFSFTYLTLEPVESNASLSASKCLVASKPSNVSSSANFKTVTLSVQSSFVHLASSANLCSPDTVTVIVALSILNTISI